MLHRPRSMGQVGTTINPGLALGSLGPEGHQAPMVIGLTSSLDCTSGPIRPRDVAAQVTGRLARRLIQGLIQVLIQGLVH